MSDTRERLFSLMTDKGNPAWGSFISNKEMLKFVDYLISNGVTVQERHLVSEPPKKTRGYVVAIDGEEIYYPVDFWAPQLPKEDDECFM